MLLQTAAALGRGSCVPRLHGDMWGEAGGLFNELRVCCFFAIASIEKLCPFGVWVQLNPERGERQADTDGPSSAWSTGTCLSLVSQSPGLASVPEIIQDMGSLGRPMAIAKATVTIHSLSGVRYL